MGGGACHSPLGCFRLSWLESLSRSIQSRHLGQVPRARCVCGGGRGGGGAPLCVTYNQLKNGVGILNDSLYP